MVAGMFIAMLTLLFKDDFSLFMFPFFHLAVRQKTAPKGTSKWDWLMFLPALLFIPFEHSSLFSAVLIIQIVSISIWSVFSVRRYNRKLAELYDADSEMSAEDMSETLTFIMITVAAVAAIILLPDLITDSPYFIIPLATFVAILLFRIGDLTFNMKDTSGIAAEIEEISSEETELKSESSTMNSNYADDSLIQAVIDGKMYLDPSLSLVSLAEKLHTNRTYLSSSIHSCRGQNFSDFINTLRINHFLDIAKEEGSNINIKDAAVRSGFNNLQSFYRNFSEMMQMTPKTWLSNNLNKK